MTTERETDITAKVEASSLGTPEAKALRASVSDEQAARIVARAKELEAVERETEALAEDERAIMLAPCECGHTINDHGTLIPCCMCGDEGDECAHTFEALLIERVARIVAARVADHDAHIVAEAEARGDCPSGKVQFATRKQARRGAKFRASLGRVSAYKCDRCEFWHLGHLPARVRNGDVDKGAWLDATRRRGKA